MMKKIWAVVLIVFGLQAIVGGGGCVITMTQTMMSSGNAIFFGLLALIGVAVFWVGALMLRNGLRRLRGGDKSAESVDS